MHVKLFIYKYVLYLKTYYFGLTLVLQCTEFLHLTQKYFHESYRRTSLLEHRASLRSMTISNQNLYDETINITSHHKISCLCAY
jgi:hypothetical protein